MIDPNAILIFATIVFIAVIHIAQRIYSTAGNFWILLTTPAIEGTSLINNLPFKMSEEEVTPVIIQNHDIPNDPTDPCLYEFLQSTGRHFLLLFFVVNPNINELKAHYLHAQRVAHSKGPGGLFHCIEIHKESAHSSLTMLPVLHQTIKTTHAIKELKDSPPHDIIILDDNVFNHYAQYQLTTFVDEGMSRNFQGAADCFCVVVDQNGVVCAKLRTYEHDFTQHLQRIIRKQSKAKIN